MILLWGVPSDPPLAAVEKILRRDGVKYVFFDQRAVLDSELFVQVGQRVTGTLHVFGESLSLDDVRAVYPRPFFPEQIVPVAAAGVDSAAYRRAAAFQQLFSIWLDLTPAGVLNRPRQMSLNYSKPYQGSLIEAAGFDIPETLLTTDPVAVHNFRQAQAGVIYKSISAFRSIVTQVQPADEARIGDVAWCPTQFQQRIAGSEVRIHVIGQEVFASEIVTVADDYRYASLSGASVDIRPMELPPEWEARCRRLTAAMGFEIAGIDLRYQDGTWYCFEVNPSPAYTYYQERTGQPIDEAVARLLCGMAK